MQKTPVHDSWVKKIRWRRDRLPTPGFLSFPCVSAGKESGCNAGDLGSIPGLGRSPGEGKGLYHATQAICLGVILTLPFSPHHFQSLSKPYLPFFLCILLITCCCHISAVLFKTDQSFTLANVFISHMISWFMSYMSLFHPQCTWHRQPSLPGSCFFYPVLCQSLQKQSFCSKHAELLSAISLV